MGMAGLRMAGLRMAGLRMAGAALLLAVAGTAGAARKDIRPAPENGPARGQPDSALSALSLRWYAAGEAQLLRGDLAGATDSFESALAADPRNGRAYAGLARAAEAQGLPGKAVRFYRQALAIDPNDRAVLELQGKTLAARGARPRAEANLDRLRKLCGTAPCPEADRLTSAIGPAPAATAAAPQSAAATATAPQAAPAAAARVP